MERSPSRRGARRRAAAYRPFRRWCTELGARAMLAGGSLPCTCALLEHSGDWVFDDVDGPLHDCARQLDQGSTGSYADAWTPSPTSRTFVGERKTLAEFDADDSEHGRSTAPFPLFSRCRARPRSSQRVPQCIPRLRRIARGTGGRPTAPEVTSRPDQERRYLIVGSHKRGGELNQCSRVRRSTSGIRTAGDLRLGRLLKGCSTLKR